MKSGVQALIINTPLWSPLLCQDQNPLWNLWFRWKHLQSSISYHWITWKFWSLWSYRTYRNPHVVIKSFWKCKWKQSKEIHLAWIAGDVAFMLSPCKTSTFMLSHSKHKLFCYPMQNIQTPKPMYQCYLPNSESALRESVKQNTRKAIQYVVFICERFFL